MKLTAAMVAAMLLSLSWGTAAARPIVHGAEINAANTGPAVAGYTTLVPAAGGEIKDGRTYPFVREVADTAIYDGIAVQGPHLLIEGKSFAAPLDISVTKPLVLRGVSVRVAAGSPWTILVRPGAGKFHLLWSDAGGVEGDGAARAPASALDIRNNFATVYRSRFSGTADGIDISGSNVAIRETLIEKLSSFRGSHNDAIQLAETADQILIQRNKILNPNQQTSCLYILGRNVRVISNYLAGGGWTIYGGARNNGHGGDGAAKIAVTGNVFGRDYFAKSGHFGPVSYWQSDGRFGNEWLLNHFEDGPFVQP
jgi:hypothetical protein